MDIDNINELDEQDENIAPDDDDDKQSQIQSPNLDLLSRQHDQEVQRFDEINDELRENMKKIVELKYEGDQEDEK